MSSTTRIIGAAILLCLLAIPATATTIFVNSATLVTGISTSGATIKWVTDVPATSRVEYGTTTALGSSAENTTLKTSHEVKLTGLAAGTKHYFRLLSTDTDGNTDVDNNNNNLYSFTTLADTLPPTVLNATITDLGVTSTTFAWETNEPATSAIYYGETEALGQQKTDPAFTTQHSLTLTTTAGKTYQYVIGACDGSGNCMNTTLADFIAGPAPVDLIGNLTLPEITPKSPISVLGRTAPSTTIDILVNGTRVVLRQAGSDGRYSIALPLIPGRNAISMTFTALDGATETRTYDVTYDPLPPSLGNLTIPAYTTSAPLKVNGSASEPVRIYYRSLPGPADTTPPAQPQAVTVVSTAANRVELTWQPNTEEDLLEYAIYRGGLRLAVTSQPGYTDNAAPTDRNLNYEVTAVDKACNEGQRSSPVGAKTKPGGSEVAVPEKANLTCTNPTTFLDLQRPGTFQLSIDLAPGLNTVQILAVDRAGNRFMTQGPSTLDTQAPVLETNLEELSPSYSLDVKVSGTMGEAGVVCVFLNNVSKAADCKETQDGEFEIPVRLQRVNIVRAPGKVSLEAPDAYENKVIIIATDLAGKTAKKEGKVVYSICGSGGPFDVRLLGVLPDTLSPRMILNGAAQIGIPFNVSYRGGQTLDRATVTVKPLPLSAQQEDEYDNSRTTAGLVCDSGGCVVKRGSAFGYLQVNINPWDVGRAGNTTAAQVANISNHRVGECFPGFGCLKLFYQVEINYQERMERFITPGAPGPSATERERSRTQRGVQRSCIPITIQIDKELPPDKIPKGFLRATVELLTTLVDTIDQVVKPLETITQYLLYGCAASEVWAFVSEIRVASTCTLAQVQSGDPFKAAFDLLTKNDIQATAKAGLCDVLYPPASDSKDGNKQARDACQKCGDAIDDRESFLNKYYKPVCDRIYCPAAPTLQHFIKKSPNDKKPVKSVTLGTLEPAQKTELLKKYPEFETRYKSPGTGITVIKDVTEGKLFSGNDCALLDPSKRGYTIVKEIHKNYVDKKPAWCQNLTRPAHPACCGVSYMREWDSACGLGQSLGGGLDFFDEIKESERLAAQKAGVAKLSDGSPTAQNLWNAAAGFCGPGGQPTADYVNTLLQYKDPLPDAESQTAHVFLFPQTTAGQTDEERVTYTVFRGYIVKKYEFTSSAATEQQETRRTRAREASSALRRGNPKITDEQAGADDEYGFYLNQKLNAMPDPNGNSDLSKFFTPAELQKYEADAKAKNAPALQKAFFNAFCSGGLAPNVNGCTEGKAKQVFEDILRKVGGVEQQIVVDPASGFMRSLQCMCMPGIISYLKQWRNIMVLARNCFQAIELTGDGAEGACQAAISVGLCDTMYDLLSCAGRAFGGGGSRPGIGAGGIESVFGTLSQASSATANRVQGRYGQTSLYRSLFSDRKLVHSICMFAFTGTWDLNADALLQAAVEEFPVNSTGLIVRADRRFVSFDPTTTPRGLTTWTYHLGAMLSAGADLDYEVTLRCSNSLNCDPQVFRDGKCDCFGRNPREVPTQLRGRLAKNDVMSDEVFHTDSGSDVRYDTAVLRWRWTDKASGQAREGTAEKRIGQAGGNPPAFCAWDLPTLSFRCSFGAGEAYARITQAEPKYVWLSPSPDQRKAFVLGEPITLDLGISQQLPQSGESRTSGQGAKFIGYTLKNQLGIVVHRVEPELSPIPPRKIEREGDYTYTLKTNAEGDIYTVQEKDFINPSGADARLYFNTQVASATSPNNPNLLGQLRGIGPEIVDQAPSIKRIDSAPYPTQLSLRIVINGPNSVQVYDSSRTKLWSLAETSLSAAEGGIDIGANEPPPGIAFTGKLVLSPRLRNYIREGDKAEIAVTWLGEAGLAVQNPCTPAGNAPKAAQVWKATITIYDADDYGSATPQPAVDPSSGETQSRDVDILVACADPVKDKLKKIGEQATAAFAPADGTNFPLVSGQNVAVVGFTWPAVPGATKYGLRLKKGDQQVFERTDFTNPAHTYSADQGAYTWQSGALVGGTWQWSSDQRRFTVGSTSLMLPPGPPRPLIYLSRYTSGVDCPNSPGGKPYIGLGIFKHSMANWGKAWNEPVRTGAAWSWLQICADKEFLQRYKSLDDLPIFTWAGGNRWNCETVFKEGAQSVGQYKNIGWLQNGFDEWAFIPAQGSDAERKANKDDPLLLCVQNDLVTRAGIVLPALKKVPFGTTQVCPSGTKEQGRLYMAGDIANFAPDTGEGISFTAGSGTEAMLCSPDIT
jgi:hypothetical protein